MKKRVLLVVMALTMCMFSVTACSSQSSGEEEALEGEADASDSQLAEATNEAIDDVEDDAAEGKSEATMEKDADKDEADADKLDD